MLSSLQGRVKDAEEFAFEKENKMSRVDITISSLKKEIQTQMDERQKLEVSLKHHMQVEEENYKKAEKWESKVIVIMQLVRVFAPLAEVRCYLMTFSEKACLFLLTVMHVVILLISLCNVDVTLFPAPRDVCITCQCFGD